MSQCSTDSNIVYPKSIQSGESQELAWNTRSIYPRKPTELHCRSTVQPPFYKMAQTIEELLGTKPSEHSQKTQYMDTVEAYDKWAEVSSDNPSHISHTSHRSYLLHFIHPAVQWNK